MTRNTPQTQLELLPWLANDTLAGEERRKCLDYSNSDLEGRRELNQWRLLGDQLKTHELDGAGEDFAWARLSRDIDRTRAPFWQQPINRAQVAAGFAALLVAAVLLSPALDAPPQTSPGFTTLSSPQEEQAGAGEVALRLVLAPLEEPALAEFLAARGATLVSRSSVSGVVIVRVPEHSAFSTPDAWRNAPEVRFAEQLQ